MGPPPWLAAMLVLEPVASGVQQPSPEVTGQPQLSIAAVGLVAGDAQGDPGSAMRHRMLTRRESIAN